jgi:Flp pilus assembly protein TadG
MGARPEEDRGAVAVIVAAMMVVFCGLLALVVDLGLARDRAGMAQNAADAAALGAATSLAHTTNPAAVTPSEITQARAVADQYATANGWTAGIGAFTVDPAAGTVTVALASQQSPRIFAGIIGSNTPPVSASAQATWQNAPAPCSMCVLGNFSAQNGQTVNTVGNVLIRGNLSVSPNGTVTSASGIVGYGGTLSNSGTVTPPPVVVSPITDPYAVTPQLPPAPPAPPMGSRVVTASTSACTPGTYNDVTACRTFAAGIYVITGQNRFTGNVTVLATGGVLLYFTCSTGSGASTVSAPCPATGAQGGSLAFGGNVNATITARTDPIYRGLAIIYDRHNTSELGIIGGPAVIVNGNVYAAAGTLRNNGNGPLTVNGSLVIGDVDLRGVPATVNVTQSNVFADLPTTIVHLTR